jgi:hypothetical protein
MRNRRRTALMLGILSADLFLVGSVLLAQAPAQTNTKPATPSVAAANAGPHVDLSGSWGYNIGTSFSPKGGNADVGTPADGVPYQPWALAKLKSRKANTGPNATFDTRQGKALDLADNADPVEQCDPHGVPRIYTWNAKFKFIQTPDVVYILYEYGPTWRSVWLNRKHPEDPDSSYWGDSIGRYEGEDTFVVDSVGFNDKTWIDDVGRPHTDMLHVIERYRRVDQDNLQISITVDDPGAYTSTWTYGPKTVRLRTTPFGTGSWVCTVDQNKKFFGDVTQPTIPATPKQ